MEMILGFIVLAVIIGAIIAFMNGERKASDVAAGAMAGGLFAGGCIMQMIFAAVPVIGGLFIISIILKGCE